MDHCKKNLKHVLSLAAKGYAVWYEGINQSSHGCKVTSKERAAVFRKCLHDAMMCQDQAFVVDLLLDLFYDSEQAKGRIYDTCEKVRKERRE